MVKFRKFIKERKEKEIEKEMKEFNRYVSLEESWIEMKKRIHKKRKREEKEKIPCEGESVL